MQVIRSKMRFRKRWTCERTPVPTPTVAGIPADPPSQRPAQVTVVSIFDEKPVIQHAKAITAGADKKDWASVRQELDNTMRDVKQAMMELNSEALSQLISIGGWLRGTEALTEVVGKKFTKDGAELLHQPVLLDYFDRRLSNMPAKYKRTSLVEDVQKGVLAIRPLIGIENGDQISEKSVKEVGSVAAGLTKAINSKSN